ncbi:hypothetical protein Cgig2_015880 [Carnegiea gigantea]|uniref:Uncharacterized protein n=1 Tax=Carnegiea gigantea TaxID=171969 RepID=A0A9Q1GUA0_9CARY|nr:hypothetical protein Cgig2_015880 [Carnegiea gigantea]
MGPDQKKREDQGMVTWEKRQRETWGKTLAQMPFTRSRATIVCRCLRTQFCALHHRPSHPINGVSITHRHILGPVVLLRTQIEQRANHGPVDNFAYSFAATRNGSVDEHSEALAMSNIQRAVEPEFGRAFAYSRGPEHSAGSPMPAVPLNILLQPFPYPPGRSIPPLKILLPNPLDHLQLSVVQ